MSIDDMFDGRLQVLHEQLTAHEWLLAEARWWADAVRQEWDDREGTAGHIRFPWEGRP